MYTPIKIYKIKSTNTIEIYEPDDCVPTDLCSGLETQIVITVQNTVSKVFFNLNAKDLFVKYEDSSLSWTSLCEQLQTSDILAYQCELPGFHTGTDIISSYVKVRDVMNGLNAFTVAMTDAYQQSANNTLAVNGHLKDISIKHYNREDPVDLSNCVPIVNGVVCYPIYNAETETLYAVGGAELHRGMSELRTPEVLLLDFTDIGGMTICDIELSDSLSSKYTITESEIRRTNYKKWDIKSTTNPAFMLPVIDGVLVLPNEVRKRQDRFEIYIGDIPFRQSQARQSYLKDLVAYTECSATQLDQITESFNEDYRGFVGSFAIILNKKVYLSTDEKQIQWYNQIKNNTYPYILANRSNRAIVASNLSKNSTGYLLNIRIEEDVKIADFHSDEEIYILRKEDATDLDLVNSNKYNFYQIFA